MPIKTKKWRNMILLICGFTLLVSMFELFPRVSNLAELLFKWLDNSQKIELMSEYKIDEEKLKSKNHELKSRISSIVSDYEENLNISSVIKSFDNIALVSCQLCNDG